MFCGLIESYYFVPSPHNLCDPFVSMAFPSRTTLYPSFLHCFDVRDVFHVLRHDHCGKMLSKHFTAFSQNVKNLDSGEFFHVLWVGNSTEREQVSSLFLFIVVPLPLIWPVTLGEAILICTCVS